MLSVSQARKSSLVTERNEISDGAKIEALKQREISKDEVHRMDQGMGPDLKGRTTAEVDFGFVVEKTAPSFEKLCTITCDDAQLINDLSALQIVYAVWTYCDSRNGIEYTWGKEEDRGIVLGTYRSPSSARSKALQHAHEKSKEAARSATRKGLDEAITSDDKVSIDFRYLDTREPYGRRQGSVSTSKEEANRDCDQIMGSWAGLAADDSFVLDNTCDGRRSLEYTSTHEGLGPGYTQCYVYVEPMPLKD